MRSRWLVGLAVAGCTSAEPPPARGPVELPPAEEAAAAMTVDAAHVGQRITVVGWAVNRKNGASLVGDDVEVWIDGLSSWPEGVHAGGERGRKLRVTGVLAQDHGLPVFVPHPDEPIVQGIPVPEGTDLDEASRRFVLRDATWQDEP